MCAGFNLTTHDSYFTILVIFDESYGVNRTQDSGLETCK